MRKLALTGLTAILCLLPAVCLAAGISYEFTLDGTAYALPVPMARLSEDGWKTEHAEESLAPDSFTVSEKITSGRGAIHGSVINLSINELPEEECFLGEVTLTDRDGVDATFAGGLAMGASRDEVFLACGTPTDITENGRGCTLVYEGRDYDKAVFTLKNDVVTGVSLRSFTPPRGYNDKARVDATLPPEDRYAYEAPEALGRMLKAGRIRLGGQAYQLPAPYSVLSENGWTVKGAQEDVIAARDDEWGLTMQSSAGAQVEVALLNASPVATTADNCLVAEIMVTDDSAELPGGLTVGSSQADVEDAVDGLAYDTEEDDESVTYTVWFDEEQTITLTVDKADGKLCAFAVSAMPEDE